MTNDPRYHHLRELSWRRQLTGAEEAELRAWLAAHPRAQAGWEAEAELNEALGRLTDAPVPANFTTRVLQAVEREAAAQARAQKPTWRLWPLKLSGLRWLPKAALAAVLLSAGLFSYKHYQHQATRRVELARILAAVSGGSSPAGPQTLQDFDTVRAYTIRAVPDEELLALLK